MRCEASAVLLLWSEDGQAGKRRNTPWNKCAAGKRLRLRLRLRGRVGVGIGVCVCVCVWCPSTCGCASGVSSGERGERGGRRDRYKGGKSRGLVSACVRAYLRAGVRDGAAQQEKENVEETTINNNTISPGAEEVAGVFVPARAGAAVKVGKGPAIKGPGHAAEQTPAPAPFPLATTPCAPPGLVCGSSGRAAAAARARARAAAAAAGCRRRRRPQGGAD